MYYVLCMCVLCVWEENGAGKLQIPGVADTENELLSFIQLFKASFTKFKTLLLLPI